MRIFLDANILFTAAHNPKGKSAFVIELAKEGYWQVVTCKLALEEATRNLAAKFPDRLDPLAEWMVDIQLTPTVFEGECSVPLPEKDRPIYLSALRARCTHLLTGDLKHFGRYMNRPRQTGGLVIQTVSDFLDKL